MKFIWGFVKNGACLAGCIYVIMNYNKNEYFLIGALVSLGFALLFGLNIIRLVFQLFSGEEPETDDVIGGVFGAFIDNCKFSDVKMTQTERFKFNEYLDEYDRHNRK